MIVIKTVLYAVIAAGVTGITLGFYSLLRILIGGKIGKARDLHRLDNKDR